jgi:molybdopterin synthase sulfur carrier subunit
MTHPSITITVKLFAAYQEAYGLSEIQLILPDQTPANFVLDRIIKEHPELAKFQDITRFGINLEFVSPDTRLQHGDELVLIPPVSGG